MRASRALAALAIAAGAVLTTAAPALAADCKTVTANIVDRPDSGVGGNWALDTFTRTVEICQTTPGEYTATGHDDGTFEVIPGATPPSGSGTPLPAGVTGTFVGDWTAVFTAAADWATFDADANGDTNQLSTSQWITNLFSDFTGGLTEWGWTYKTCSESWLNTKDGNTGDITTVPDCPTTAAPTTAAQTTTTTKPAVTTTTTTAAAAAATTTGAAPGAQAAPELPVTGGSLTWLIVVGVVLAVAGVVLVVAARRRATAAS